MYITACIALGLCLVLAVGQSAIVAAFLAALLRRPKTATSDTPLPKAAVVLALRGPDPFLGTCLRRLLAQEYPDYTVFIVVDNEKDPVHEDLDRILSEATINNIVVSNLKNPLATCSLKCSALIQAVSELDETYEVVAFLDGDVSPHATWLADLITPLHDHTIGVTYGNRWYVPTDKTWGGWVRYCWNVGAVVQVWLNGIVWAGSMAMRADTIKQIQLLEAWSKALSVDATIHRQLGKYKYDARFVPSVMMVNRETISLQRFVGWMQRQLVAAKSTGNGFRLVSLHALNLTATQVLAVGIVFFGLITGDLLASALAATGLGAYWGTALLSIAAMEWAIRRMVKRNGEDISWRDAHPIRSLLPSLLLTQVVYPYALVGARSHKQVSWRGIKYDIRGFGDVLMREYHPYVELQRNTSTESVV
ncbi:MAG: glycosyltransferase family 2 protein [Planctomycetaceae bacterium]|nr:glycosyltransferase family 2 protein [Planctomycetales bacterium]MCB9927565.1 glycosyltransferase family 2 protein [Planctomycetaceae bacterium]